MSISRALRAVIRHSHGLVMTREKNGSSNRMAIFFLTLREGQIHYYLKFIVLRSKIDRLCNYEGVS